MKVIELLNRIANDEGVPIKIKYNRKIYEYQEGSYDYVYYVENNGTMLFLLTELFNSCDNTLDILNIELKEVEIIEEEKKIEKFDPCLGGIMGFDSVENIFEIYKDKINEIIDYLQGSGKE